MTILEQLADYARERTEQGKRKRSLEELKKQALSLPDKKFEFENAIKRPGLSFICECKKASPSRGIIVHDFTFRLQKNTRRLVQNVSRCLRNRNGFLEAMNT